MPTAGPGLKRTVRAFTRRLGYDLVPFRAGFAVLQANLMTRVDLVIDVGANVGQYAERVRALGYQGHILSFEPQRLAYDQLMRTASRDPSWVVRQLALGESTGAAELFRSANSVSSSLHRVQEEHTRAAPEAREVGSEYVQMSTLDKEVGARSGTATWLKLDVQGHELAVLRGGSDTLAACLAVQVELSFAPLYAEQADWVELCSHLTAQGLVLRHLEPGFEDPTTGHLQQADALFVRTI